MLTTPSDIRNYATVDSPDPSQHLPSFSKTGNVDNVAHELTASSSAANSAQSGARTSLPSCLSGNIDDVRPACSNTNTSVTTVCTTNRCEEEILREMFPSLEQEKISQTLTYCNMNVQEATNRILQKTGMVKTTSIQFTLQLIIAV